MLRIILWAPVHGDLSCAKELQFLLSYCKHLKLTSLENVPDFLEVQVAWKLLVFFFPSNWKTLQRTPVTHATYTIGQFQLMASSRSAFSLTRIHAKQTA